MKIVARTARSTERAVELLVRHPVDNHVAAVVSVGVVKRAVARAILLKLARNVASLVAGEVALLWRVRL